MGHPFFFFFFFFNLFFYFSFSFVTVVECRQEKMDGRFTCMFPSKTRAGNVACRRHTQLVEQNTRERKGKGSKGVTERDEKKKKKNPGVQLALLRIGNSGLQSTNSAITNQKTAKPIRSIRYMLSTGHV